MDDINNQSFIHKVNEYYSINYTDCMKQTLIDYLYDHRYKNIINYNDQDKTA